MSAVGKRPLGFAFADGRKRPSPHEPICPSLRENGPAFVRVTLGASDMSLSTPSTATLTKPRAPGLIRGLNAWHATSIVAGTIIGSGIFLVPAEMMQAVGSAGLVYLAWIV